MKIITLSLQIIWFVILPQGHTSDLPWKYKDWSMSTYDAYVRYVAEGKNIPGHLFGFLKMVGNCNQDILWISWLAYSNGIEKFQGSDATIQFQVDDIQFQLQIPVLLIMDAFQTSPSVKMVAFSNFQASDKLISLMERGQEVGIKIIAPKEFAGQFEIVTDSFSLNGFITARLKSREICEGLN